MILSIALMFNVLDNIKHNFTLKKGKEIKTKEVMVICIIEVHMETLVVTKTLFNRNFAILFYHGKLRNAFFSVCTK